MKLLKGNNNRNYDIVITDTFNDLNGYITKVHIPSSILVITDDNVAKYYLESVCEILGELAPVETHIITPGEQYKNLDTITDIYNTCIKCKLDRSGMIVALGGGVVGDIAGFVASSYMRGVPFIQIPTTIVAQNDSSIGGKVGVDYLAHKNMVGAFYNPILVYINTKTLSALPQKELIGGLSEVIKHGLIRDESLFEYLYTQKEHIFALSDDTLHELTYMSCSVKADVVSLDLKESGLRKILNFGHTIGHAIETLSDFSISHGEAVAYGSAMASYISYKRGYLTKEQLDRIIDIFKRYGLLKPLAHFSSIDVINQMSFDKKKSHNKVSFILLEKIGKAIIVRDIEENEIKEALDFTIKICH